jgi:hypothetical protein
VHRHLVVGAVAAVLCLAGCGEPAGRQPVSGATASTPADAAGTATLGAASGAGSASATAGPSASAARTTPPPPSGGKPGPANTGVPAGTPLTAVRGDQVYATPNQVITGLDIHGYVRIRAKNVTIRNSIIRGGSPRCNAAVIVVDDGASARIEDSEIVAEHPNACLDGIWATDTTMLRLDISNVVDGVKAFDNVTLQDSYVHDLARFASDPNQGGGATHNDAVQTFEGNRNVLLRHNTLLAGRDGNAAYQVTQDGGRANSNIRVELNWLDGGGCTLNFSHSGGPAPMTGIFVVGNRFGRGSQFDCPILLSTQTSLSENRGNVWDDNGQPIPQPQQHD